MKLDYIMTLMLWDIYVTALNRKRYEYSKELLSTTRQVYQFANGLEYNSLLLITYRKKDLSWTQKKPPYIRLNPTLLIYTAANASKRLSSIRQWVSITIIMNPLIAKKVLVLDSLSLKRNPESLMFRRYRNDAVTLYSTTDTLYKA